MSKKNFKANKYMERIEKHHTYLIVDLATEKSEAELEFIWKGFLHRFEPEINMERHLGKR